MSPLAERVVALQVCTKCHKKTLVWRASNDLGTWLQCEWCLTVFCLPAQSETEVAK